MGKTGISVGDYPDRAAGGQTLGLALGGGGPLYCGTVSFAMEFVIAA